MGVRLAPGATVGAQPIGVRAEAPVTSHFSHLHAVPAWSLDQFRCFRGMPAGAAILRLRVMARYEAASPGVYNGRSTRAGSLCRTSTPHTTAGALFLSSPGAHKRG